MKNLQINIIQKLFKKHILWYICIEVINKIPFKLQTYPNFFCFGLDKNNCARASRNFSFLKQSQPIFEKLAKIFPKNRLSKIYENHLSKILSYIYIFFHFC